ncbi:hypothetical protein KW787_00495 [Candidatus Pacearchaeota archaeon]|nr:hypothetical protein [Candidatus Pacearchaeota archaeon]
MDKKGDLPMLMLPLIALGVSIIALLVFNSHDNQTSNESQARHMMISEMEFNYNYVLSSVENAGSLAIQECKQCSNEELKSRFMQHLLETPQIDGAGNLFVIVGNRLFQFSSLGSSYDLSIPGLFVQAQNKQETAIRRFDIHITFDRDGKRTSYQ